MPGFSKPSAGFLEALRAAVPARVRLIPFHPAHTLLVEPDPRLTIRQQLYIYGFQAAGGPAFSICVDETLTSCFGLFPCGERVAELWMLGTNEARARFPKLILQTGRAVVYVSWQYLLLTKLQIRVQRTNEVARRYAERLGFHMEPFDNADEEFVTMEATP
jgi:hypothetical protein